MDSNRYILPFYMTYPGMETGVSYRYPEEDTVLRDLEYLQQMYPAEAKRYQSRISRILDRLDYEGSMIYDEYPDKYQLYSLADNMLTILRREEQEKALQQGESYAPVPEEKWKWLADMIQVLLFYEIYKRRHRGRRGYLKF